MAQSFLHPQQNFSFSPRKFEPPRTRPIKPTYFLNPTTGPRTISLVPFRLEGNRFSGSISGLSLPSLQGFNVSGNALADEIPNSLLEFPTSAFEKNSVLCGIPLEKCKLVLSDPTRGNGVAIESEEYSSPSSMSMETKPLVS
ncbi:putative leucine-rich repeat receptor-like protein kinase [Forsythia ovata]|uniref:Leucine-rich repeat receptor-like protein kinase n=1 Tax=Forsythia ovata TaxID=205694 RepID=A0ABD1W9J8_9LAMI